MFYFYTGFLGFSPAFMGRASMAAAVATLCGILIYNRVTVAPSHAGHMASCRGSAATAVHSL